MKKLITLSLMTVCFGLCAVGCTPKPATPTQPSASPVDPSATSVDIPVTTVPTPPLEDATKTDEKPEETPAAETTPEN
jgi:hypothetical protein